jgi:hypothetical protein
MSNMRRTLMHEIKSQSHYRDPQSGLYILFQSHSVNIAKFGKATQKSTGWSGVASRAIDGNTYGSFYPPNASRANMHG